MKALQLQLYLRHLYLLVLALLVGALFGQGLWWLLMTTLALLAWHLYNLGRLVAWTSSRKNLDIPNSHGIWGQVFDDLHNRQQRHNQRKRTLSQTLKRFVQATAAVPDGTVVVDEGGYIEWCNPSARKLLGLRWPKDAGQRLDNLIRHPSFLRYYKNQVQEESSGVEIPSPRNRNQILLIQIVPYGKSRILVMARDVTVVKRLERMRGDFVSNVSHELKTPLTVINGYLEILETDIEPGSEQGKTLMVLQRQTQRMISLVDDLLTLTKLENESSPDGQTWINVCALIEDVILDSGELNCGQHQMNLDLDPDLTLLANPQEIRSAFSNLVFNAVRYTPPGGHIHVRWQMGKNGPKFEVQDNGPGISQVHLSRLTERFYRVDVGRSRQRGGTGLGLAIVKHILLRHDAELSIKSQLGEGSCFSCRFPAARGQLSKINSPS